MPAGWLDLTAGASGDMLLGAVVDAGAPWDVVTGAVAAVCRDAVSLRREAVTRHGLGATRVHVTTPESNEPRTWSGVRALLQAAPLAAEVRDGALAVFDLLARAEAAVHRIPPDDVHFHEVGAWDALADVVGVVAGVHDLGVTRWTAGPVSVGSGRVHGEHGVIPVPAPAVLEVLRGVPVEAGPVPHESCTPTGAALVRHLVTDWGPLPPLRVTAVGHGAGGRDPAEHPNLVRMVIGEPADGTTGRSTEIVVEANVDDLDPRAWPHVLAALMRAGAADVWATPILMKKGRPAHTLSVLCRPGDVVAIQDVIFAQTSTIGVRLTRVEKLALPRASATVQVHGHGVGVKIARRDGRIVNVGVEHDDVAAVAAATGRAFRDVLAAAQAAALHLGTEASGE